MRYRHILFATLSVFALAACDTKTPETSAKATATAAATAAAEPDVPSSAVGAGDEADVKAPVDATAVAPAKARATAQADVLITRDSPHGHAETVKRYQAAVAEKGLNLFTTIEHHTGAEKAGLELPPTTLLVFGNPKLGTQLMHSARSVALDLPMKALVWDDDAGKTHITWRAPAEMARAHAITDKDALVQKASGALDALAEAAVAP